MQPNTDPETPGSVFLDTNKNPLTVYARQGPMDAIITALSTSVLGTLRVLAILLAGFFASRWPKSERGSTNHMCAGLHVLGVCM